MEYLHSDIIYYLTAKIGGSISDIDGEKVLHCYNNLASGKVVTSKISNGISYIDYDMVFKEDATIRFNFSNMRPLLFLYSMDGAFSYSWDDFKDKKSLSENQSSILIKENGVLLIHIPADKKISFGLAVVQENASSQIVSTSLNKQLFKHFEDSIFETELTYQSSLNLKVKAQLVKMRTVQQRGVIKKMLNSGILHCAIALQVLQFDRDMANRNELKSNLSKNELDRVKIAIDLLLSDLQKSIIIETLCSKVGLNPNKLQEGFKELTGETVNNFTCNERLKMAEHLIKQGEMNISQIVYSIGLSSRSYFSKVFKEKYNCSPKEYQMQSRRNAFNN